MMWLLFLWLLLWPMSVLIGTAIMGSKNPDFPEKMAFVAIFSLPHAVVFGPFWLLLSLTLSEQQMCPHCRSSIDSQASVCPKCTRQIAR